MQLKEFKNHIEKQLSAVYPITEIHSFFTMLLQHYLEIDRLTYALQPEKHIPEQLQQELTSVVQRLRKEEPIQYILGETAFYGLHFKVNRHTLIPRPETEELVDWVIRSKRGTTQPLKILDVGTGSGCIAVSLAKNLPNAEVYACDISKEALIAAQENAQLNGGGVTFFKANALEKTTLFPPERKGEKWKYDIIISNPPYVRTSEKTAMHNNVLNYEPHQALYVSDEDPLVFYRSIAEFATKNLTEDGLLFFETNQYLAEETKVLLQEKGFRNISLQQDLFGNDRMLKAMR